MALAIYASTHSIVHPSAPSILHGEVNIETPQTSRLSSPAALGTRRSRATVQMEENPAHIADPSQRKKVQNRIAQRTYRKRTKRRMEALESFREASTSGLAHMALIDVSSPDFNASKELYRHRFQPITSPATSTPPPHHLYGLPDRVTPAKSSKSISSSERDEVHAISFPYSEQATVAMVTPRHDTALSFKPDNDNSGLSMWDYSQAIDIGLDVEDISKHNNTPESASTDLAKEFTRDVILHDNAPDSHNSKTALHIAAENGKISTLQLILGLQPDVLAQDATGRTALHLAVSNSHHAVIQELLKNPICLNVQDRWGQTALHAAAARGHELAVARLLAAGADVECKDSRGQTAVHLAAANGCDSVLQLLFNAGADINAKMKSS